MKFLNYRNCLGLDKVDRKYYVSAGDINPATGKAYAINPSNGHWDDNYFAQNFGGASQYGGGSGGNSGDVIANAQKLRDFTVQNNAPAIQSLQGQKSDLQTRYSTLLDSIHQSEQPALNSVIQATNNEMGRRGITSDSGLAQNQVAQAQLPVSTAFGQLTAQTGLAQQGDLNNISSAIASLQAGNPEGAYAGATGIYQSQNALAAAQAQAQAQVDAAKAYSQYHVVPPGGSVYNAATGQTSGGGAFTPSTTYSGGGMGNTSSPAIKAQPISYNGANTSYVPSQSSASNPQLSSGSFLNIPNNARLNLAGAGNINFNSGGGFNSNPNVLRY